MRKLQNKRTLPDPFFQRKHFFTIWDDSGQIVGTVYVLDSAMMPQRKKGVRKHEAHGHRSRNKLRRMGHHAERKAD
ncbi:hypothetical protein [Paenibacillus sophorae]|uniref:Uncharacterized protein n=1 Tax=Paenibacillus sophorae TaxID=1333845 RepID=A0ABX8HKV1_9BACL|nr:hypothetical protein [Paenibacillus sophorae]QWU17360.1 hypothetical protein KP014_09510 [Paenibacillus sophorae]